MMLSALACREQHLSYEAFWDQPKEFIETFLLMLQNEAQAAEMKNRQK